MEVRLPVLMAMSVAAQVGWAMLGVLSGSRMGATGALLLAANIAIAVPLLVVSYQKDDGRWTTDDEANTHKSATAFGTNPKSEIGLMVGVASLMGLPPFGGFAGTLMVAQAAANIGGALLGVMLLGTLLLGIAWASVRIKHNGGEKRTDSLKAVWTTPHLLIIVLIATQLALFLLSSPITNPITNALGNWAGVPWLSAP